MKRITVLDNSSKILQVLFYSRTVLHYNYHQCRVQCVIFSNNLICYLSRPV